MNTLFVDVILPLAIPNAYTYRLPKDWNAHIKVGQRVVVQFGKGKKQYSAVVSRIHEQPPSAYQAKYIETIVDEEPILHPIQLEFWRWIADYYMANLGEVMNAALPSGLRLASETRVLLHPNYQSVVNDLTDEEYLLIEALELRNVLELKEISEILGIKYVQPKIKRLIDQKALMTEEEIKMRYKPKMVDFIELSSKAKDQENLKEIFDDLQKAPKQMEALMGFLQMSRFYTSEQQQVKKLDLQKKAGASPAIIKSLIQKGVFTIVKKEQGRLAKSKAELEAKALNEHQKLALEQIETEFKSKQVCLLHGVTSSGKTEVYIHLIQKELAKGKQVLYLLPEIALTTQIVQRLQSIFGEKVGVYHSRFNENERVEVWNNVLRFQSNKFEEYQIILGARSALFLPFSNLGLVIIDEEHETTFKQHDPSPRYQARDSAMVLAKMQQANVLLGSATPSIESYYNANQGKYGLVELNVRHGNIQLPEILCADVKEETKKKKMKSHFSSMLLDEMEETLENDQQIILFQNRRGYSPILLCETCGNSPQCINCDVSMTYHKFKNELVCHYCGYHTPMPTNCPSCGDQALKVKGFGTEKIEEELAIYLPEAKVARMDLDTTRAKKAYYQLITAFEEKEIDILVGTQMVTKGLDFDNVGLVGVLSADQMLQFPDFRAFERSYQLMSQVAGRAGRKNSRGKVIIQSFNPDHPVIRQVIDSKYQSLYKNELFDRRNFKYPPFYRLIKLTLRDKDQNKCKEAASQLTQMLRSKLGDRILGPEAPSVARVRNNYLQNIMVKIEKKASLSFTKTIIQENITLFRIDSKFKSIRISIDVDPY